MSDEFHYINHNRESTKDDFSSFREQLKKSQLSHSQKKEVIRDIGRKEEVNVALLYPQFDKKTAVVKDVVTKRRGGMLGLLKNRATTK